MRGNNNEINTNNDIIKENNDKRKAVALIVSLMHIKKQLFVIIVTVH